MPGGNQCNHSFVRVSTDSSSKSCSEFLIKSFIQSVAVIKLNLCRIISSILALAYIVPSLVALTVYGISRTSCTENRIIGWAHGIFQTCIIDRPIDVDDMKIRNIYDTATHGLWFKKNDDVKYLPIELSKSFPKLKMLDANSCSIKKISKTNFKGLKELSGLFLDDNLIVAIHSDTFKDLTSLQWLSISEYQQCV